MIEASAGRQELQLGSVLCSSPKGHELERAQRSPCDRRDARALTVILGRDFMAAESGLESGEGIVPSVSDELP